jgi:hypothetical protein
VKLYSLLTPFIIQTDFYTKLDSLGIVEVEFQLQQVRVSSDCEIELRIVCVFHNADIIYKLRRFRFQPTIALLFTSEYNYFQNIKDSLVVF